MLAPIFLINRWEGRVWVKNSFGIGPPEGGAHEG